MRKLFTTVMFFAALSSTSIASAQHVSVPMTEPNPFACHSVNLTCDIDPGDHECGVDVIDGRGQPREATCRVVHRPSGVYYRLDVEGINYPLKVNKAAYDRSAPISEYNVLHRMFPTATYVDVSVSYYYDSGTSGNDYYGYGRSNPPSSPRCQAYLQASYMTVATPTDCTLDFSGNTDVVKVSTPWGEFPVEGDYSPTITREVDDFARNTTGEFLQLGVNVLKDEVRSAIGGNRYGSYGGGYYGQSQSSPITANESRGFTKRIPL